MNSTFAETRKPTRPEAAIPPIPLPGRRPRICFVAPTIWPMLAGANDIPVIGGAELQQTIVARALARRGYPVSMISMDFGQEEGAEVDGIRVHKIYAPDAGIPVVRFLHPRLTSLWQALKRADADVYYQRTAAATAGFMAAFCRRHGKRSIHSGASDVDFVPGKQDLAYKRDQLIYEWGVRNVDTVFRQGVGFDPAKLIQSVTGRVGLW